MPTIQPKVRAQLHWEQKVHQITLYSIESTWPIRGTFGVPNTCRVPTIVPSCLYPAKVALLAVVPIRTPAPHHPYRPPSPVLVHKDPARPSPAAWSKAPATLRNQTQRFQLMMSAVRKKDTEIGLQPLRTPNHPTTATPQQPSLPAHDTTRVTYSSYNNILLPLWSTPRASLASSAFVDGLDPRHLADLNGRSKYEQMEPGMWHVGLHGTASCVNEPYGSVRNAAVGWLQMTTQSASWRWAGTGVKKNASSS